MRLAAILLIPALLLGFFEGLLRIAGVGYDPSYFIPSEIDREEFLVPNPYFSYRFFPPALARTPVEMRMPAKKDPGTFRIFLFGESAAYGDPDPAYGVGRYLEKLLENRFPEIRFEVICTAMTAINSHAILPIARECAELEGDLWIVYMGNNEMVGSFGAGTVFSSKAPPLGLVRLILALKKTRTGQLMDLIAGSFKKDGAAPEEWDGINMFSKNLGYEDPGRLTAYDNFQGNLRSILKAAGKADVPVLCSTVATNLKHCAPFNSLFSKNSKAKDIAAWKDSFEQGKVLEAAGAFGKAIESYNRSKAIDSYHAELLFRLGRCHAALGQFEKAGEAFSRSRDMDGLAVRADSRINSIIRDEASRAGDAGAILVDSAQIISDRSPGGIPGHEWFYEHVHFILEGNFALAGVLAENLLPVLPESIRQIDRGEWADFDTCNRHLAATLWDQHRLWNNMSQRLTVAPHTSQLNNSANVAFVRNQAQAVIARIDEDTPAEDRRIYLNAIARDPSDNLIQARFGQYLEAVGERDAAIRQFEKVCDLLPDNEWAHMYLGEILGRAGRYEESAQSFRRALEIRDDIPSAKEGLKKIEGLMD